jgi:rhodanese-related sulfurtransferase
MKQARSNMQTSGYRTKLIVLFIALAGGLTPLVLYYFFYGRVPNLTPVEAKEFLRMENTPAILVDIQSSDKFGAAHIDGTQNLPLQEIIAFKSLNEIPEQFRNRNLLLISEDGMASNFAAKHLIDIGLEKVANVRGGTQGWIASVARSKSDVFDRWKTASGEISEFPFRRSPWHEQLLAVISGYVIKPLYTLLSLALVVILWRSRSADLVALRWGLIFFFIGENCCAINYLVFNHTSYFFEYLHSFGMLLCFGFVTYAALEGIDQRIIMLSGQDQKCAALSLCNGCIKYTDAPCGLKRTFFIIIPALIFIAFMPLCADWHNTSYNTVIFGTFYNYSHGVIQQQFEILYCPIIAIVMLVISMLILFLKKENPLPSAKIAFAAGIGPMSFGAFRMILTHTYSRNLMWSGFWEETTELLFVAGICVVLWIFRHGLFRTA